MVKKVGFSASRCMQDILAGKVDINDVVSITASTLAPTKEKWMTVVSMYYGYGWICGDLSTAMQLGEQLWDRGLIHQPRNFGAQSNSGAVTWMDLIHTNEDRECNPALKEAWESALLIEGLVSTKIRDDLDD